MRIRMFMVACLLAVPSMLAANGGGKAPQPTAQIVYSTESWTLYAEGSKMRVLASEKRKKPDGEYEVVKKGVAHEIDLKGYKVAVHGNAAEFPEYHASLVKRHSDVLVAYLLETTGWYYKPKIKTSYWIETMTFDSATSVLKYRIRYKEVEGKEPANGIAEHEIHFDQYQLKVGDTVKDIDPVEMGMTYGNIHALTVYGISTVRLWHVTSKTNTNLAIAHP